MCSIKICVIGLGYVGLSLACLFSTKYENFGFDMNQSRIEALTKRRDATLEISDGLFQDAINNHGFKCTSPLKDIRSCNVYIIAVPVPDTYEVIATATFHVTKWKESCIPSWGVIKKAMKENPVLIDGRNVFSASELDGVDYLKIG